MKDEPANLTVVRSADGSRTVAERPSMALVSETGFAGHLLGRTAEDEHHIVQFYQAESFLADNVAHYIATGLAAQEPVIVFATQGHCESFLLRLKTRGCDPKQALESGQLLMLDARATLGALMVGDSLSRERFQSIIGDPIEKCRVGRREPVRVYGEIVDLLWKDGNKQGAIALERFWNELATRYSFTLLCGYAMGNFYNSADGPEFQEVCETHTHVIPTESYAGIEGTEARLRAISSLEQRARSLESEMHHRKELEATLREALARETIARQEAERSVRYNEMFAGILGHDLRNPLAAITMGANYISRIHSGEKTTKAATRILSSAERMSRMIDQLLDFTRIRVGGGLALAYSAVDLATLCYRVKEELEAANPDCFIRIETEGDTVGQWDYDRLLQVFSNLVSNAISHGAAGCTVRLKADGREPMTVLALVRNEGVVAPDVLPVMFEPFRGTGRQSRTRGLGLGLYITRQIVLAHGGSIDAQSNDAEGTPILLTLPRRPTASADGEGSH